MFLHSLPAFALIIAAIVSSDTTPATQPTDSVLGLEPGNVRLANDDVGVILWGTDATPTLSIGKSDVWDRRNPKPPQPVLTLKQMITKARAGDRTVLKGASYYTAYGLHDFPCPKPVGQLIFRFKFMKTGGTLTVDRDEPRAVRLRAINGDKRVDLRIFVSSVRNVIVIGGEARGLANDDVTIRLYRHRDTIVPGGELHPTIGGGHSAKDFEQLDMPRAGFDEDVLWIAQDFTPEPTFPNGFTSVLAARVVGARARFETAVGQTGLGTPMRAEKEGRISHGIAKRFAPINQSPGASSSAVLSGMKGRFQLVATVVTTQDDPDPLARARRNLAEAVDRGVAALWKEHAERFDAYESRPHARAWSADGKTKIDAVWGGVPYRVRPAGFYGDVALCSVDSTKHCFQDSSRWHADFHFNEVEATVPCVLRQFDTLDSYFRMIHEMLPMAQANAREVYDCAGAMYPLIHYPLKADTVIHSHLTWEQSMEITALLAKPFWLRFLYTWDVQFLRSLAYPVLREGARFYADFLRKSDDGLYHVFPTVSPEHRGITNNLEFNRDSQSGITLIRYHLRAAAGAAKLLNTDTAEAVRWREIAEHMPDYPTVESSEGPIYIDVAGAKPIEYNIAVPLTAIFWGDDIGLDSPPAQLDLARRTLRLIDVWKPHQGYLTRIRRRVGIYEPADDLSVENFLQSYTGVIRAFPTVPDDFEGGFENLGAQGAFIVSAIRTAAGTDSITLKSLAGNPVTLANPWPGRSAQVTDRTAHHEVVVTTDVRTLRFTTKKEHTYHVTQR